MEYQAWLDTVATPLSASETTETAAETEETAPAPAPEKEKSEWVRAAETAGEERGSGPVEDDAPYPTSFADIVELIVAGKPIPGIKEIPDVVLDAPTEAPAVAARKKPWET